MAFKIKDLDSELGSVVEQLGAIIGTTLLEEVELEYQILCETCCYSIEKFGINVHLAELLNFSEETKIYELTDLMYLFFDDTDKRLVYSEQGGTLKSSICNYLNLVVKEKNYTMSDVEDLDCTYMTNNFFPHPPPPSK